MTLDGAIECLRVQAKENEKSMNSMKHLEAKDEEKFAEWLENNSYLNWVGEGNDVNSMSAKEVLTEWQKGAENEV